MIFGAVLDVNAPLFVLSLLLSIATIFSLGLVLVAITPSQAAATGLGGVFTFGLMFLAGLWTPSSSRWTVGDNHLLFSIRGSCQSFA